MSTRPDILDRIGPMLQKPRLHRRMPSEQPHQFRAAIPPKPNNSNTSAHLTIYSSQ